MQRHVDREAGWPWPLHAFLAFVVIAVVAISLADRGASRVLGLGFATAIVVLQLWLVVRRRRLELDDAGIRVGAHRFAWADVEETQVRDGVPRARLGLFIRLTADARTRLGLPAPRLREHGFGLHPPPTPERDAARYDLFLRGTIEQLEAWVMIINVKLLRRVRENLEAVVAELPRIHADLVVPNLTALTVSVHAASADDLLSGAGEAIAKVLPDEVRWDPGYAGGMMVLVGPLSLQQDPRAEELLERVKAAVAASIAGKPRIHAMFAERQLP